MVLTAVEPTASEEWMQLMRRGDWEGAWRVSDRICLDRRGKAPRDPLSGEWLPRHLQWVWDGTPLAGKRVLVRCYHGLGDTIQFVRFLPELRRLAVDVTLWAQPQLLPLLTSVPGVDTLLPLTDAACNAVYDVDIEIMELPHALRATLETLPRKTPYIYVRTPPGKRKPDAHPSVGLVWQSGSWDPDRSVKMELIGQLTRIRSIDWKILQRGPALAAWPADVGEIPHINDIVEEAAELQRLDLLITVDTLSAHLAGALAVPTWTLLPAVADWRWMEGREDTPWYPTMRLFRQSTPGDWESVLARVARALEQEFPQLSCAANRASTCLAGP